MLKKIKNIIHKTDLFLFRIFGTEKNVKFLENLKEAKIIFSHLNKTEEDTRVRFVGGCVRKALCAEEVDDIDLATSLEPNEIKNRLEDKGIKVIDTGISHGTVTAILNKKKFEITTLRKDVSTDGRHAKVEFTTNWEDDALRRDFTINAIYSDINGKIFDPLNGIEDLINGNVKFIGSTEKRIQEDYLRILRYFRFFTQYSKSKHSIKNIQLVKQNINGLNKISNERIFDELQKILSLKNLSKLFNNKDSKEIILNIFPQCKYPDRLNKILETEVKIKNNYDNGLLLALLIIDETDNYEYFCHKYKTSNTIKERFKNISKNFGNLNKKNFYSNENLKKLIYFNGKDNVRDLVLFTYGINNKIKISELQEVLNYISSCKVPKFPITGDYLKNHGYITGPELGKKLKFLEEKWINNNFILDKNFLKKSLYKNTKN